jgi:pimeloyl-ACP methyl ester carboxylesterase
MATVGMWAPTLLDLPSATMRLVRLGPAGAPPLVVVPDAPNVLEHHRPTLEALAGRHRVVACEMPGFGRSRLRGRLSFAGVTTALAELLEHLALGPVTLEIACVGALAGLHLAAKRPDLIARLVLVQVATLPQMQAWARNTDVSGVFHTPVIGPLLCRLARKKIVRHWYGACLPPDTDDSRQHYTTLALESLAEGASFRLATAYQALARAEPPPLDRIEQPALLLFGAADRTHAETTADALARSLPRASLELLPHSGHFPTLEAPDLYASRLAGFIPS